MGVDNLSVYFMITDDDPSLMALDHYDNLLSP